MSRAIANSGITNSSHAHLAERGLQICDGFMGSGTFHCPALLAIVLRREEASRGWAGPALLPGRHCEGSRIRHLSTSMTQGALRTRDRLRCHLALRANDRKERRSGGDGEPARCKRTVSAKREWERYGYRAPAPTTSSTSRRVNECSERGPSDRSPRDASRPAWSLAHC